jgi:Leucine-rich repeat (LRR) protein
MRQQREPPTDARPPPSLYMPSLTEPSRRVSASTLPLPMMRLGCIALRADEPPAKAMVRECVQRDSSLLEDLPLAFPKKSPLAQFQANRGSSPVGQGRAVDRKELGQVGMVPSSGLPQHIVGTMRDTSERLADSLAALPLPKKSPLRSHVNVRARHASCTTLQEHSSTQSPARDAFVGEHNSSNKNSRQSSSVDPQALWRAGLLDQSDLILPDTIVWFRKGISAQGRLFSVQVPIPKKSPLQQYVQRNSQVSMSPTRTSQTTDTAAGAKESCSRSPVRRSQVDPKDLARVGDLVSCSQPELPGMNIHGSCKTRQKESAYSSHTEVPLPKGSPLRSHVTARARRSFLDEITRSHARRRRPVEREELGNVGLLTVRHIIPVEVAVRQVSALSSVDPSFLDDTRLISNPSTIGSCSPSRSYVGSSCTPKHELPHESTTLTDSLGKSDGTYSVDSIDGGKEEPKRIHTPKSCTASPNSGLRRNQNDDAICKIDMRISHSSTHAQTNHVSPSQQSGSSVSSSVVYSDSKIKAGLRANRLDYAVEISPAISGTVAITNKTENIASSRTTAMLHSDAKLKRGLRQSDLPKQGPQSSSEQLSPTSPTSDNRSDARVKAGLRNYSTTLATTRLALSEGEATPQCCNSNTKLGMSRGSPVRTDTLTTDGPLSPFRAHRPSKSAGLRRSPPNKSDELQIRASLAASDASDDSNVPYVRPGAYSATTPSHGEFSVERVSSLGKGGMMALLGLEGVGDAHHEVSSPHHNPPPHNPPFNVDPSTVQHIGEQWYAPSASSVFDLEEQPLFKKMPPLAADVRELVAEESPEKKGYTRRMLFTIVALLVAVAVVVGIVVVIAVGGASSEAEREPTSNTTILQGDDGAELMLTTLLTLERLFEDPVAELPAETLVAIQYGNETEPQVRAFRWIMNDPNLDLYTIAKRKQRLALATFFFATNGLSWFEKSATVSKQWLDYNSHECDWFSLAPAQDRAMCKTSPTTGRLGLEEHYDITSLVLSGSDLWTHSNGLPNPKLVGTLCKELTMLTSLEHIDLGVQKLRGTIPELELLSSSLKDIVLYDNLLTGKIPSLFFSHARKLWLSYNDFEPSTIPSTIGSELSSLALTESNIFGSIPSQLATSTSLQELYLGSNEISGSIPSEIGDAVSLRILEIHNNLITSTIPTDLGRLTQLTWLSMEGNQLTGTLCSELAMMARLEHLRLSTATHKNMGLQGTIPFEFYGALGNSNGGGNDVQLSWNNLKSWWLSSTQVSGSLATQLGLLSNLQTLVLDSNDRMSGSIPSELGTLGKLQELGLSALNLQSTIPSQLGLLSGLAILRLHDNKLSGGIPSELSALVELEFLKIDGNNLLGPIPPAFCDVDVLDIGCAENGLCGCDCPCPFKN